MPAVSPTFTKRTFTRCMHSSRGESATAKKLKDASTKAAAAATQGEGAFAAAFKDMTSVCKECHESFREKVEK